MLYTFLVERQAEVFLEQVQSPSPEAAVYEWHRISALEPGPPPRDQWEWESSEPVPVDTVEAVWCYGGIQLPDVFDWIHIVETARGWSIVREVGGGTGKVGVGGLYTFVTFKEGGTYIQQVAGKPLAEAIEEWSETSITAPGPCPEELLARSDWPERVPGKQGLWWFESSDPEGRPFELAIVATKAGASEEKVGTRAARRG